MKELTDFPKNDQEDPTEVFTDIHFGGRSVAHEAYHLSHGSYPASEQVEIHPQVEGHLMDARVQGE